MGIPLGAWRLRAIARGINLPESRLQLAPLTRQDLEDLRFVALHANIVEMSFAISASDVDRLHWNCSCSVAEACDCPQDRNTTWV